MSSEHVVVWRYRVPVERRADFERAYGPAGPWVALFGSAEGYLGTTLLRALEEADTYLTIDRWRSPESFERFREQFAAAYEALDRELEGLGLEEMRLGAFEASVSENE
jgi:heme-degrading monooxygenase HmoA